MTTRNYERKNYPLSSGFEEQIPAPNDDSRRQKRRKVDSGDTFCQFQDKSTYDVVDALTALKERLYGYPKQLCNHSRDEKQTSQGESHIQSMNSKPTYVVDIEKSSCPNFNKDSTIRTRNERDLDSSLLVCKELMGDVTIPGAPELVSGPDPRCESLICDEVMPEFPAIQTSSMDFRCERLERRQASKTSNSVEEKKLFDCPVCVAENIELMQRVTRLVRLKALELRRRQRQQPA